MADQFDAFQKEVEEDLQRERMQKFWKDYGTFILLGCVALVLGVAGYKYLEARRIAAAEATSRVFSEGVRALTPAKGAAADAKPDTKLLASLTSNPGSYGTLAKLRLAAADAAAGETSKAVAAYDMLAAQAGIDPLLADYARLQSAMLTIDTASWTDVQNRVNTLTGDDNPWRHAARELLGMAAFKAGKFDEAKVQLSRLLADPSTPRSISERVGLVLADIAQSELAKAAPQPPVVTPPKDGKESKLPETKAPETKAPAPADTKPAATEPPAKKKK